MALKHLEYVLLVQAGCATTEDQSSMGNSVPDNVTGFRLPKAHTLLPRKRASKLRVIEGEGM